MKLSLANKELHSSWLSGAALLAGIVFVTGTASCMDSSGDSNTVPSAPAITLVERGNASAMVTWTAPASTGGTSIFGYTAMAVGDTTKSCATYNSAALTCTITGLTNGTSYTFKVRAINAAGASAPSAVSMAVIPAAVPGTPMVTSVTAGDTSATVIWTVPSSTGGSAITGYSVKAVPDTTKGCTTADVAVVTCTVTGLTNNTSYTFMVRANNIAGASLPGISLATVPWGISARSLTPVLVDLKLAGVSAYTLISSDDILPQSPTFVFGGSADGAGLLKNTDGTFTFVVNNEDNWSVARITLDKTFTPVKGDYIVNSSSGNSRLCSGTLITPEIHGFGPLYFSGAESGIDRATYSLAINPNGAPNSAKYLPKFGLFNTENIITLPKTAYSGKTVMLVGNDNSDATGGQVALYVSNTVGDLDNGKLYALARTDSVIRERSIVLGTEYNVVFKEITNPAGQTKTSMADTLNRLKVIKFGRVEDLDYGKTASNREVYFTVTGQPFTGVNADSSRTRYGRVYKLTLDASNPLTGKLEVILDGDIRPGVADKFQDPDNITVTQNYVYIEEDPNTYGDETHDAYIYQYNLATKALTVVMELNHHRGDAAYAKYNQSKTGTGAAAVYSTLTTSPKGSWEYGALIDISSEIGQPDVFLLSIQPHSWIGAKYLAADGGVLAPLEDQASEVLLIKGLPR